MRKAGSADFSEVPSDLGCSVILWKIAVIKTPHTLTVKIRIKLLKVVGVEDIVIKRESELILTPSSSTPPKKTLIKEGQLLLRAARLENTSQTDWCVSVWGDEHLLLIFPKNPRLSVVLSSSFCTGLQGLKRASYQFFLNPGRSGLTAARVTNSGLTLSLRISHYQLAPSSWISPDDENLPFTRRKVKAIGEGSSTAKTRHQTSLRNPRPPVCEGWIITQSQIKATRSRQENQWEINIFRKCA